MNEVMTLAEKYVDYLLTLHEIKKPIMPNFDLDAYTDNNYIKVLDELTVDFDSTDDLNVTLRFLTES